LDVAPFSLVAITVADFKTELAAYSRTSRIVSNVYQIAYLPVTFGAVRELIVVTLVPFLPVALLAVPFDVLITSIGKLFL